ERSSGRAKSDWWNATGNQRPFGERGGPLGLPFLAITSSVMEIIAVIRTLVGSGRTHRWDCCSGLVPRFINTTTFVASIFGSGEARRGSIPRSGAVTEEQRSQNRKATQPSGRRFFLAQTSLLTPYRPLKGMRVARASSGPKIRHRKRGCIYGMGYLGRRGVRKHLLDLA